MKKDDEILVDLGLRLKYLRLKNKYSQKELSDETNLSLNTIKAIEKGNGKLSTLLAVLGVFNELDLLKHFISDKEISPIELAKRNGYERKRVSRNRKKKDDLEW